jgi:hypothetical protein
MSYVRTIDRIAELHREALTTHALQTVAFALARMVADAERLNSRNTDVQTTELNLTADEAAAALAVINAALKPLPEGTMTA